MYREKAKPILTITGWWLVSALILLLSTAGPLSAEPQEDLQFQESYLLPNEQIQDILNRDKHFDTLEALSPDGTHLLIPIKQDFSSLKSMTQKTYRLGMLELCPAVNREWRLSTYGINGLKIYSLKEKTSREVKLPAGTLISDFSWSPDGKKIAFLAHLPQGTQVWTADAAGGKARAYHKAFVMATISGVRGYRSAATSPSQMLQWTPDGNIITLLVPQDRGPEPAAPAIPSSPIIRTTREKATPTSTYPFLLRTPHDAALFAYYTTSQPALLKPGKTPQPIGKPGMVMNLSLNSAGTLILIEKLVKPFSYITNYRSFPRELSVMDLAGKTLATIRKVPLQEAMERDRGKNALADLPREVTWIPDGSSLGFLLREEKPESEEEESTEKVERKDRIMSLAAPFDITQSRILAVSDKKYSNLAFSADAQFALVKESGKGKNFKSTTDIVAYELSTAQAVKHYLVKDIDPDDILKQPGDILTAQTTNGLTYARISDDGKAAFLRGTGIKENFKPQPFIDRVEIATGETTRIFESAADSFEQPLIPLDDDLRQIIVSRESKTVFPNSYLRGHGGALTPLTRNIDPFPEVASSERIDFTFERRDGLVCQGRITMPPGYRKGTRVPTVFWTYPREFASPKAYKRAALRSRNQNAFAHLNYRNASDIWLTQGYAVAVPDIPIIGKAFNDNYVAHLVDSMHAAIRQLDRMELIDVDRLGHGGHSYGAFATANILSHSPFFQAGIAGDGAYNRTLTPMSFQSERRFIWEIQDVYLEMSPFFVADHMDTPLLMYHGAADNNTGTFLIQSERYIQALTGLGKTAALYIYPFESHGPRCKETYMDMWARWLNWFDTYVKKVKP